MSKDNKNVIDALKVGMVEFVQKSLSEDFATLVDEDATKALNEFNSVIKRSCGSKDTIAWRPPGDPLLNMLAHDGKVCKLGANFSFS